MPAASVKVEKSGGQESPDVLNKLLTVLQERTSKLEKQKTSLDKDPAHPKGTFYKELSYSQITYKKLNPDQMTHLRKMDMAHAVYETVKEISDIVKTHIAEFRTHQKRLQKKASQEKARENYERVKDVLKVQTSLHLLAENPEMFSGENSRLPSITPEVLERLQKVNSSITPPKATESQKPIKDMVTASAEHIHLLLEGRKKFATKATSYEFLKDLVFNSVVGNCFYVEQPVTEESVEEKDEEEPSQITEVTEQSSEETKECIEESVEEDFVVKAQVTMDNEIIEDVTPVEENSPEPVPSASLPTLYDTPLEASPPPGLTHPQMMMAAPPQDMVMVEEAPVAPANNPHNVSISEFLERGSFDFLQDSVIDNPPSEVYRDPAVVSIGSSMSSVHNTTPHLSYNNTTSTSPPLNHMSQSYSAPHEQFYTAPPPAPVAEAPLAPPSQVDPTPNPPPPIPMPVSQETPTWRGDAVESWGDDPSPVDQWADEPQQQNGASPPQIKSSPPVEDWAKERSVENRWDNESMQWNEEPSHYRNKDKPMESWGDEPRGNEERGHSNQYNRPGRRMRMEEDGEGSKMWGDDHYDDRSRGGMYRRGGRGQRMNGGYRGRNNYSYQNGRGGYGGFRGNRGMSGGNGHMRGNMRGSMNNGSNRGGMNNGHHHHSRGGAPSNSGGYRGSNRNYNNQQSRSSFYNKEYHHHPSQAPQQ